jgi:hypothetical protein
MGSGLKCRHGVRSAPATRSSLALCSSDGGCTPRGQRLFVAGKLQNLKFGLEESGRNSMRPLPMLASQTRRGPGTKRTLLLVHVDAPGPGGCSIERAPAPASLVPENSPSHSRHAGVIFRSYAVWDRHRSRHALERTRQGNAILVRRSDVARTVPPESLDGHHHRQG